MRAKKEFTRYFILFLVLMTLLSMSTKTSERYRGFIAAIFAPLWSHLNGNPPQKQENAASLIDNHLLTEEIGNLKEMVQQELQLISQWNATSGLKEAASALQKRHRLEFQKLLMQRMQALPAKVIFRSPSSWNSSLWINVGEENNLTAGKGVVSKNSPVLANSAVIGVVDYVGKRQSRVRLITDSGLTLSVRASRGNPQCHKIHDSIERLITQLTYSKKLFEEKACEELIQSLKKGKEKLLLDSDSHYLAKGEIHGSGHPLWRRDGFVLQGTGFNYDFSDEEGPPRDLRSGRVYSFNSEEPSLPILQLHDLLVTTGMDGVFPAGLPVAEVSKINLLKEGDYFYRILATPAAGNLEDISMVFVLPASGYDAGDLPPLIGW